MAAPMDFYFDFSSPYGYFAAHRIDAVAAKHGRKVVWHPFLLGPAFAATGMKPLLQQPMRGEYALHDWRRLSRRSGLPFRIPEGFPFASLAAGRIFYWLAETDAALAKRFALAVYRAYFGEGRDMAPAEAVAEVAAALGIDRAAALAAAQDPVWKARLKDEGDRALARGAFGSPYIIIDGEPFFGNDRLEEIDQWLETGGW